MNVLVRKIQGEYNRQPVEYHTLAWSPYLVSISFCSTYIHKLLLSCLFTITHQVPTPDSLQLSGSISLNISRFLFSFYHNLPHTDRSLRVIDDLRSCLWPIYRNGSWYLYAHYQQFSLHGRTTLWYLCGPSVEYYALYLAGTHRPKPAPSGRPNARSARKRYQMFEQDVWAVRAEYEISNLPIEDLNKVVNTIG